MRHFVLLCSFLFVLCSGLRAGPVDTARRNGVAAQQALIRSRRVLHAYLERLDPVTGLLPRNGSQPAWFVRDSAADLYPFLVMAAWFTDRPVFKREMTDILRNEIRHSTRVGMLSDNVLPGGKGFVDQEVDLDRIIFGSCEYAKDGLLPLTELLGQDGIWYTSISLDGKPLDSRHAHCWGYMFNAVYTTYLITGEKRFLDAVTRALQAVTDKPTTYLDDPAGSGRNYGSNAYSDALESAIVFLNRLPDERSFEVLDHCVARFLARQRENGIIEDWYGDGNYVRTALMVALMKSQGTWLEQWREDLRLGAARVPGGGVLVTLESDTPWLGRVHFDYPRHKSHFNLTVNYPRLNEFPEWFTVRADRLYSVRIGQSERIVLAAELVRGLEVALQGGEVLVIEVSAWNEPPYGETNK